MAAIDQSLLVNAQDSAFAADYWQLIESRVLPQFPRVTADQVNQALRGALARHGSPWGSGSNPYAAALGLFGPALAEVTGAAYSVNYDNAEVEAWRNVAEDRSPEGILRAQERGKKWYQKSDVQKALVVGGLAVGAYYGFEALAGTTAAEGTTAAVAAESLVGPATGTIEAAGFQASGAFTAAAPGVAAPAASSLGGTLATIGGAVSTITKGAQLAAAAPRLFKNPDTGATIELAGNQAAPLGFVEVETKKPPMPPAEIVQEDSTPWGAFLVVGVILGGVILYARSK